MKPVNPVITIAALINNCSFKIASEMQIWLFKKKIETSISTYSISLGLFFKDQHNLFEWPYKQGKIIKNYPACYFRMWLLVVLRWLDSLKGTKKFVLIWWRRSIVCDCTGENNMESFFSSLVSCSFVLCNELKFWQ